MAINIPSSFGFTAFFKRIIDGRESVVTPIMKERTTPKPAPFASSASAMGIQPKISAYMGTPATVAITTPNGLSVPNIFTTMSSGIQLVSAD